MARAQRLAYLAAAAAMLALLSISCGGAVAPTTTATRPPAGPTPTVVAAVSPTPAVGQAPAPTATPVARSTPTAAPAPAKAAGRVIFASDALGDVNLGPTKARNGFVWSYFTLVYDSLVGFRAPDGALVPALATKWEADPNALGWTFTIRTDVRFQNGAAMTAEDVAYSVMLPSAAEGVLGNVLKGAKVIDPKTVQIVYSRPLATLPHLPVSFNRIMPKAYLEQVGEDRAARNPIGAGPLRVTGMAIGESVDLQAWEGYYDSARTPSYLDLKMREIIEPSTRLAALQVREVDIAAFTPVQIPAVKKDSSLRLVSVRGATNSYFKFSGYGIPGFPTNDFRVARAMSMAIDRQALAEKIYNGAAIPAAVGYLNPGSFGYNPDIPLWPYDLKQAKQLLADAGYSNGFEIEVMFRPPDKTWVEAVAAMWQDVGIRARLSMMEPGAYTARWTTAKGNGALAAIDATSSFDRTGAIQSHVASQARGGSAWSYNNDPKLDDLITPAVEIADVERRLAAIKKLTEYMREYPPVISVLFADKSYGLGPRIESWPAIHGNREPLGLELVKLKR
ncbi:MAG: ABC transporter substrate-binding protein [Chloroflexi bacterium]|nr:ABC transporter substrate-binding protein [Chloroflexota bacterium]